MATISSLGSVVPVAGGLSVRFEAMACPCEVLVETENQSVAQRVLDLAAAEALRVERKFSRYRSDSVVHEINSSNGSPVSVDDETAHLIFFAAQCHELSDGLFDITSGILRRVWTFNGGDQVPTAADVNALLPLIGWTRVQWDGRTISLPAGMQIDLGGIGKEYVVDRCLRLLRKNFDGGILVNFGGDLAAGPRKDSRPWVIGIERPDTDGRPAQILELEQGAIATSGDAKKFIAKDGRRFGHILNPKTGWPVEQAPRSVTVMADTCTEAGFLTTLGMLQGAEAENFLEDTGAQYWCFR